jgi:1-acyl-sn-glycerol-3-phosphate acyltransferase
MEVLFVVKDTIVSNPIFGPVMGARFPIEVSRNNSRDDLLKVLNEGSDKLTKGFSIAIFPQATRRDIFIPSEFNSLGIKLASRNSVDVIPIALRTDFWRNGKLVKDLGPLNRKAPVMITFGKPVTIVGNGKAEHTEIVRFIESHLTDWGCKVQADTK